MYHKIVVTISPPKLSVWLAYSHQRAHTKNVLFYFRHGCRITDLQEEKGMDISMIEIRMDVIDAPIDIDEYKSKLIGNSNATCNIIMEWNL